jgi:predicted nucleic acid-binding protein
LDASIAVKWLNPHEILGDKASLMRLHYERGLISLILPGFWDYEVANGINKAVARGHLSEQEGAEAISILLVVRARKEPLPGPEESYALARKYQRSVYDSWYLDLAEKAGCDFWTADHRLYNAVKEKVSWVKWLGDYESPR